MPGMTPRHLRRLLLIVTWIGGRAPALLRAGEPISVMSFNIRYGTARDGDNHWEIRCPSLFVVFREQDADIVGSRVTLHRDRLIATPIEIAACSPR
jgi:hypothetical protein